MSRRVIGCGVVVALAAAVYCVLAATRPGTPPGSAGAPGFIETAAQSGLRFQHFTGGTGDYHFAEITAPGVALIDYDNDGDLDVFVTQGTLLDTRKSLKDAIFPLPVGQRPGYRLFRNEMVPTGQLSFTDVTEQAGVGKSAYGMGVAVGDYDNDGYPDILVTNFGSVVLFHNERNGTFRDVTRDAGLQLTRWATSATFFDYDRDGRLDLFVTRYDKVDAATEKRCQSDLGGQDFCGPKDYPPDTSVLFHNLGNGKFRDVSHAAGIDAVPGRGLGVVALDFNHDGWPDIFVANDREANFLWQNLGNGTFREVALERGCAMADDARARAGMGVDISDFSGDGNDALIVGNFSHEGASLYAGGARGDFSEIGLRLRLLPLTEPYTTFGAHWLDYDNDGFPDIALANGAAFRSDAQGPSKYPYGQRNLVLHNDGGKALHSDPQINAVFSHLEVGRGLAVGDLDNDGRTDLVIANNNGPLRLFRNQVRNGNHWLDVELEGVRSNRMGIGCRVIVFRKDKAPLWRRVHTDGSYLSASEARAHFGLATDARVDSVMVEWTDGNREMWKDLAVDRLWHLREGGGVSVH